MFPELFTIPGVGFTVKSYGAMIALGFLLALWTATKRAERMGIHPEVISDLSLWLIVGGVIGARIFYVVQYWETFRDAPLSVFKIWQGGLVFYGGFLAALAAGFWWAYRRNLDPWPIADCVSPSVILAYALGRVGCFLNGCCWGYPVDPDHVLAVSFPAASAGGVIQPLFQEQIHQGLAAPGDLWTHPVFPAQILSALIALLLFAVLDIRLVRRRYAGQVFFWMLMGYAAYRFGIEFLRDDTARWPAPAALEAGFPGLTIAQWISPVVFVGAWLWSRIIRRRGAEFS